MAVVYGEKVLEILKTKPKVEPSACRSKSTECLHFPLITPTGTTRRGKWLASAAALAVIRTGGRRSIERWSGFVAAVGAARKTWLIMCLQLYERLLGQQAARMHVAFIGCTGFCSSIKKKRKLVIYVSCCCWLVEATWVPE